MVLRLLRLCQYFMVEIIALMNKTIITYIDGILILFCCPFTPSKFKSFTSLQHKMN